MYIATCVFLFCLTAFVRSNLLKETIAHNIHNRTDDWGRIWTSYATGERLYVFMHLQFFRYFFSNNTEDVDANQKIYSTTKLAELSPYSKIECHYDYLNNSGPIVTTALYISRNCVQCLLPNSTDYPRVINQPVSILAKLKNPRKSVRDVYRSTILFSQPPLKLPSIPPPATIKKVCACVMIWSRASFLLEWVHYHSVLHNISKFFIYDNDSQADHLKDVVTWLSFYYNMSYTWWPYGYSQMGANQHCFLQASTECEWISYFDVDEFIHLNGENQILTDVLSKLPSHVGGLALTMQQYVTNDNLPPPLRIPGGGVVQNYLCSGPTGNIKSIVRSVAVHPTIGNIVHFFVYANGFTREILTRRLGHLAHYKVQAWEVYGLRYLRQPSDLGKSYKPLNRTLSIDAPFPEFIKEVKNNCVENNKTFIRDRMWCSFSGKNIPDLVDCTVVNPKTLMITGSADISQAKYSNFKVWLQSHFNITSKDVIASWRLAACPMKRKEKMARFHRVLHVTYDPLTAIPILIKLPSIFCERRNSTSSLRKDKIREALHHWVRWNELIGFYADWTYRLEDIQKGELCLLNSIIQPLRDFIPKVHTTGICNLQPIAVQSRQVKRQNGSMTWEQLMAIDGTIAKLALAMALRYGYTYT